MPRWFLSYNSQDVALAERFEAALKVKDPGGPVFFAPKKLRAGGYWLPQLAEEIAAANAFVLLVGDKGLGPWQVDEYYEARDRRVPVVLLLLEGQSAPGLPFLRTLHWIVSSDPASDQSVTRLLDAAAGGGGTPGELWRYAAPYRGLASMTEADCDFFFGRGRETVEVLRAIETAPDRLPVLLGNSGVGKSSLAQAGALSCLKRQAWPDSIDGAAAWPGSFHDSRRWCFLTMRPGTEPLKALIEPFLRTWQMDATDPMWARRQQEWIDGLLDGALTLRHLLDATERRYDELNQPRPPAFFLYVDQGEELYVRAEERQRRRFSEALAQSIGDPRLRALMSLRADFFGVLQSDEPLFGVHRQINVAPLRETELREVISRPASLLAARFETAQLADVIARRTAEESARDAGALPLLSYLLDDMWTQMVSRGDGVLRLPAQAFELGGVLADRANAFLLSRPGAEDMLRRILTLKLATVRSDGEPTRRRALRSEFTDEEWQLVSELADHPHRLLVTATPEDGETYAEVAHEAIFRRWEKLREWMNAERDFLVWRSELEAARRRWQAAPESSRNDALLMGLPLAQAQGWFTQRAEDLPRVDREYIETSRKRETLERAQKERLQRRVLWVAAAALVFVSLFAGFAGFQWFEAERLRGAAEEQRNLALERGQQALLTQSRFLADLAKQRTRDGDAATAILLALEALPDEGSGVARPYAFEAEAVLAGAVQTLQERMVLHGHTDTVFNAQYSPDGKRIVSAGRDLTARIWDAATGETILTLRGHDNSVLNATFSSDGRRIATGSYDKTARVWDAATGKVLATMTGHEESVGAAVFSPDGRRIVTASRDKTARIWDAATGRQLMALNGHNDQLESAAYSRDGTRIVTSSWDHTARIWNAATGETVGVLRGGHTREINDARFSPDGRLVVTASADKTARLWSVETSKEILSLRHDDAVASATFSADGKRVLTASRDRSVRLWDAETGKELLALRGHDDLVGGASFSPDGRLVVSGSTDWTVRVWDLGAGKGLNTLRHEDEVWGAAFSPDGKRVVTASRDRSARIWSTETGEQVGVLMGQNSFMNSAFFSPDGRRIVTANWDNKVRIWNAAAGRILSALEGHEDSVLYATFSPDGTRIASASADKTARVWDSANGDELVTFKGHTSDVRTARFSPDGKRVVSASWDNTARVWDAETGKELLLLRDETFLHDATFSPDGKLIATASLFKTVRLWDAETGQQIAVLQGYDGDVRSVAFSSDGRRLLTASDDLTMRIWDLASRKEMLNLRAHDGALTSAAYSPDGRLIVTASEDHSARLWRMHATVEQLIQDARRAVPRCLSRQRREAAFLPPEPPTWCIELGKWPYQSEAWTEWLANRKAGRATPIPSSD